VRGVSDRVGFAGDFAVIWKLYLWLQELSFDFSEWMIRIPIRKACRLASKAFKSQQLSDYDLAIRVMSATIRRLPGESMAKNHANHLLGRLNEGRKRALAAMMASGGCQSPDCASLQRAAIGLNMAVERLEQQLSNVAASPSHALEEIARLVNRSAAKRTVKPEPLETPVAATATLPRLRTNLIE
jgi:hypothetical protein